MAVRVLIGSGGIIGTLQKQVPEQLWKVTQSNEPQAVIDALLANRSHAPGSTVFTNASANWIKAQQAGWRVVWCGASRRPPIGTIPMPAKLLDMTVSEFSTMFWRVAINDRRTVRDVITGRVKSLAPVMYVTGGSGGLSKTVTARRLAERASAKRIPTLLVDANMAQSSQWSYFHEPPDARSVADWRHGEKAVKGANQGKKFGVPYDLSFAPPMGVTTTWGQYRDYIGAARELWKFVVVDLDHITGGGLTDTETADGALLAPGVRGGDLCLYIIRAGIQTEADGIKVLAPMHDAGMPKENIGIKLIAPQGVDISDLSAYERKFDHYGMFLGVDTFSAEAGMHLMKGDNNWPDEHLDGTRERVLDWAFPDHGFNPETGARKPKKKGLFG